MHSTNHRPDQLTIVAGAAGGLAVLLLIRRYAGIAHDSLLYLGQGLAQLSPGVFGRDLFFMHGSQDSYTLFPLLLGQILRWLSPSAVFMWGTLAGLLAFATASWYCLRALLPAGQRYWAWLGVLCLPPLYGVVHIFSYSEGFLTPRAFAEALCLLAIGLLTRGKPALACATLALAASLHPLQAIAAVLVAWPWAVLHDRRWLHAAWLAIPLVLLAWADIAPFGGLFQAADPAWLGSLQLSVQLFVTSWDIADLKVLGLDIFLLVLAWKLLPGDFGRWCAAALSGLALGFGANLVLVDLLHLVLPTGLQLWRVHWLAHWFAMAAAALLLVRNLGARDFGRALVLTGAATLAWGETDWGWLAMCALYAAWPRIVAGPRKRLAPLLTWLVAALLLLLLGKHLSDEFDGFRQAGFDLGVYALDWRILAFPALALGLPMLCVYAWGRLGEGGRKAMAIALLAPVLVIGMLRWDARSDMGRTFEAAAFRTDVFGPALPEDAQVFWEPEAVLGPWLVLHRASYFSYSQLAGQMFHRGTAQEGRQREQRLLPLMEDSFACRNSSSRQREQASAECRVSDESMRKACAPGYTVPPDYLVMPYQQPQPNVGSWVAANGHEKRPDLIFYLYRCADVATYFATLDHGGGR